MAITTNATTGLIVTTAAKNGTLPGQTPAGQDQIIFDTTIATNNGNLEVTPTFVGRKVIVRRGQSNEETAKIVVIDGTGLTGTLHQSWTTKPSSGETYHVSYEMDDVATLTGLTLVAKTNIYDFSRQLTVGDGTNFAYLAAIDGIAISNDDIPSTGYAGVTIESNGRLDIGYLAGEVPVGGTYWFGVQTVNGAVDYLFKSGSTIFLYDGVFRSAKTSLAISSSNHTRGVIQGCKFFDNGQATKIFSGSWTDINFAGTVNSSAETITLSGAANVKNWTLTSMSGVTSLDNQASESLSFRDFNFVQNPRLVTVYKNKYWYVTNPTWSPVLTNQNHFWFSGSSNFINEYFSFDGNAQTAAGSSISGSEFYIYEGKLSSSLANSASSNVSGAVSFDILHRTFSSASGGSVNESRYGQFALKVYKYPYSPFVSSILVGSGALAPSVTLIEDASVTQPNFDGAIFSGSNITISASQYSTTLLTFISNSLALTVGETVTGATSTASGVVVEVPETGSLSGKIYLRHRNGTGFVSGERLNGSVAGASAATASLPVYNFKWEVSGSNKSLGIIYDYCSALLASQSIGESIKKAISWGEAEHGLIFKSNGSEYYTDRNINKKQGVYVSRKGAGNISYFTDDSGSIYVPPTSVTLTLNNVISGSRCLIQDVSGNILMSKGAESSTVSEPYTYIGDVEITVRVRKSSDSPKYLPYESGGTISTSGFSLTVNQILDSIIS